MTDEEYVKKWLKTPTGKSLLERHPELHRKLTDLLKTPPLPMVDPVEGIGQCSCGKMGVGGDVRFGLSEKEFMTICPFCASWSTYSFNRPPENIKE